MRRQGEELTFPANPAGGDIAAFLRVKMAAGVLAVAGLADRDIGTMIRRYVSAGLGKSTVAAVLAGNAEGSRMCIAAKAIAIYTVVHTAASGKVSDTAAATGFPYGLSLSATTADGDEIEVMPFAAYPAVNP